MDWLVKNAVNRDVERQHLNKILQDIKATVQSVTKQLSDLQAANGQQDVQSIVGAMVSNNVEKGLAVSYNPQKKTLDFVAKDFTISLAGDVTGSATVSSLNNVTINTELAGAIAAPDDGHFYWQHNGQWEAVLPAVEGLQYLEGSGIIVRTEGADDGEYAVRTIQGPMSVAVTDGDGILGNPSLALVNDEASPGTLESYATNMAGDKGWYKPALFESTGILDGGALSINAGDNTKFDVSAAIVGSTDYSTNSASPTRSVLSVGPFTAQTVANLAVVATYIGIQMPGGTIVQQSSPYTAAQRRTIAPLGAVVSNGTNLIAVNNLPDVMRAGINQIQDLLEALGPINRTGNLIGPNGANLQINKSAGVLFKQGSNFQNNEDDPHNLALAALTAPANIAYRTSTGVQAANTNSIDALQYESAPGVLSAVPNNRFTIQRISLFTSNLIRIQYGQHVYQTMADAEAALVTESFNTEQNIAENGALRCFLIVEKGATDLSDGAQAKFIPASKFGGALGSGGTSITDTDSLPEGLVNLYYTDDRARAAVITSSITNGDTTHSPSGDAVFDALASAVPSSRTISTTAPLAGGGDLSANRTLSITAATPSAAGSMSAADKAKLDAITGTNTGDQTTITGNAGTATALQTARNINGTGFNGTADITTALWGTARTITIGSTGKSVNGSANVSWSLGEIGAAADSAVVHIAGSETITGAKTFSTTTVIGTVSNPIPFTPTLRVEFEDTIAVPSATFIRYGANAASGFVLGYKARGTAAAPTQALAGDALMAIRGGGWLGDTGAFGLTQAGEITIRAAENFDSGAQGTRIVMRTSAIGTAFTTDRFTVDHNGDCFLTGGRLYGTALHNNAAGLTGTTNQYIGSGTYTPTYTGVANIAATTASTAQWMRVGNVVTVSARVNIQTTAAAGTLSQLTMTLPIASALTDAQQVSGAGGRVSTAAIEPISVAANSATDEALITFFSTATANAGTTVHFTYVII